MEVYSDATKQVYSDATKEVYSDATKEVYSDAFAKQNSLFYMDATSDAYRDASLSLVRALLIHCFDTQNKILPVFIERWNLEYTYTQTLKHWEK